MIPERVKCDDQMQHVTSGWGSVCVCNLIFIYFFAIKDIIAEISIRYVNIFCCCLICMVCELKLVLSVAM